MNLGVKTLGKLVVQTFTTHVSNHLITFPMYTECKKEGQKPIKRPKLRIGTVLYCLFKIINLLILIVITSCPHLLNFLLGTGNKVLIKMLALAS